MRKLNNYKWFVLGIVVCLISITLVVPALAAAFTTKAAQLEYSNMKITLNGNVVTPTDANGKAVEPFVIDGTTYLPVRAISNALGMSVDWDSSTNTVVLQSDSANFSSVQAMGYYKLLEDDLNSLYDDFSMMQDDISWVMDTTLTSGPYAGKTLCYAATTQLGSDLAVAEEHYTNCKDILSSEGVDLWYEYKRLTNLAISYYKELDGNPKQSFIDRVVGTSTENMSSCYLGRSTANLLFWKAYQAA